MSGHSLSKRYFLTLLFNVLNSFMSFITSILIIRYLTPVEYGNYQFLFSIFVTIFTFSNLNTQNGYFTFLSKKKESIYFYRDYLVWEFLQLFIVIGITIVLYFTKVFNLFLGLDIFLVLLALVAVFFTKNIRELITNTFESQRMTSFYLKAIFIINLVNFLLILFFVLNDILSISIIFLLISIEFFIYLLVAIYMFMKEKKQFLEQTSSYRFKLNIKRYYLYVKPLFFSSLVAAVYLFLERWLLQKYGGAQEQAYLALAIQFSTIILILTTSIVKVFWKEVAQYIASKDLTNLENIFINATKNIFIFTSFISVFFILNAKDILLIIYGEKYLAGAYVFMLISFYTIHQTLGQLYGTFMLASENTKEYSYISVVSMLLALPLLFVAVMNQNDFGFGLGAVGVASIMVFVQLFSVNIMGYIIKKKFGFESLFLFQIKYLLVAFIVLGIFHTLVNELISGVYIQVLVQSLLLTLTLIIVFFEKIRGYIIEK